jgi:predicted Co/Zn/Cd cation transporter (cation efflux family)
MTKTEIAKHDDPGIIEQRSLNLAKWANLFMAIAGITAAWASRSDALLVDGLYSGVNFFAAMIAVQVGRSIARAPDRRRPFGYDADEAIYITFRSLTLLGIIVFAVFNSSEKILVYATGDVVPELILGPIVIYAAAMVAICAFLAFWHHRSWTRTGRQSEILKTESRAAIVDGVLSAGTGTALVLVPFLKGTALSGLIPIADAIVVLAMSAFIIRQPIVTFLDAFGEIAGYSMSAPHYKKARRVVQELAANADFKVADVAATKLGRSFFIVAYLDPGRKITSNEVDALNSDFAKQARGQFANVKTEIIITEQPRIAGK